MNVLIIEDDPDIGKALQRGFSEAGHECTWARNGEEGLELARTQQFEGIILDLLLPGRPGLEVLRAPMIISSSRSPWWSCWPGWKRSAVALARGRRRG
jgi:DNA-binding response OmpR family regulator